jgi:hydrogenase expression/formation protein HypC
MLTPEAKEGDYVLVHTGFAISVLDEEEARETLALLSELADAADEQDPA